MIHRTHSQLKDTIKLSHEKRHIGRIQKRPTRGASVSSPCGVVDSIAFPELMCDSVHGALPTGGEFIQALVSRISMGGPITWVWLTTHVTKPEVELMLNDPKP